MPALLQFAPSLREFDGVGNEVAAFAAAARRWGLESRIYAEQQGRLYEETVEPWNCFRAGKEDLLLVHYPHTSMLWDSVFQTPVKKVMLFHRVTPPELLAAAHPIQAAAS